MQALGNEDKATALMAEAEQVSEQRHRVRERLQATRVGETSASEHTWPFRYMAELPYELMEDEVRRGGGQ